MDFELLPTINLRSRSFNVLQAPRELFIQAINQNLNLQQFKVLYVDQVYGQRLAEMAKMHSSEAFYALDDPLEAAVFSALRG